MEHLFYLKPQVFDEGNRFFRVPIKEMLSKERTSLIGTLTPVGGVRFQKIIVFDSFTPCLLLKVCVELIELKW